MDTPNISKSTPLSADLSVEQAFTQIVRHNFKYIVAWEPIAHIGEDIEGVHQVRVGFRRMRSALSVFRPALPREATAEMAEKMRWAASELGYARDMDVFLDEGLEEMAGRIPPLESEEAFALLCRQRRDEAYEPVRALIESDDYRRFKLSMDAWLKDRGWRAALSDEDKAELGKPITPLAAKVLDKRWKKVTATADITQLDDVSLHAKRIECKKMRYAAEFFLPLFDAEKMSGFISALKGLQDILGVLNDVAVLPGLLDRILDSQRDPRLLRYAGATLGWRASEAQHLRRDLPQRWAALQQAPTPWASAPDKGRKRKK
ncbi:CHAD domain-containing protein [Magnetofaba australis]|uniref:Putative CHAD domain-containing protein n=1 Tax=Magnetofaba australis IT-1 TaxID=1434232 RepID=A0A1Y2K225_9PROT|nr:CHAD domain-containing protein [Magnetofaba australis]OSM01999.1 putative CHAD domain-containing protein [Magnetofaba australis IT-1]